MPFAEATKKESTVLSRSATDSMAIECGTDGPPVRAICLLYFEL